MVTVASELTVPRALRLIPISPLPTTSGTIDIGAAFRPPPACCGALPCLLHQTMPARISRARMEVRTSRRRDRGLAICEGAMEGASLRDFIGLFMNLPSDGCFARSQRFPAMCRQGCHRGSRGTAFERLRLKLSH